MLMHLRKTAVVPRLLLALGVLLPTARAQEPANPGPGGITLFSAVPPTVIQKAE